MNVVVLSGTTYSTVEVWECDDGLAFRNNEAEIRLDNTQLKQLWNFLDANLNPQRRAVYPIEG